MSIFFNPSGLLNVAQDASDLPEESNGNDLASGAMTRCKNLRLNQRGIAKTRDGCKKLNATAIETPVWWIEEQGGSRYAFAGTRIYEDETSIKTGLASAQWSAIQYNAYNDTGQNVFALNGTDRKRIEDGAVYEWGIEAPTVAPTFSVGGGDGLTGEYNARYTYARKVGSVVVAESDPSPVGTSIVLANKSMVVNVTQPTDAQVTHIRLYRTSAGGSVYNHDQDVPVGTTYTYSYSQEWEAEDEYVSGDGYQFTVEDLINTAWNSFAWEARFADLSTTVTNSTYSAPVDGNFESIQADADLGDLLETDHDRPPLGSVVLGPAYDGTCFILKGNLLYYCKPKQPEYWPTTYYIEVGAPQFPLKTGVFHNGQLYVFSKNEIFYIQGTGHQTFFPLPMRAKTGAQSINGAVSVTGKGIFHLGPDGIYLFASGSDTKITEDSFEPLFRGETVNGMPGVEDMSTAWLKVYRNTLYFGHSVEGVSHILAMNLDTNRIAYLNYNDGSDIEITALAVDQTNNRFLIGDRSGYVRVIESPLYTDDDGAAIAFELQSKDYTLATRRHFPRWVKYDVDATSATVTGRLLLDGAIHHAHTITGNRDTRRRLVDTGNGNKVAIRISGTGQVSIYGCESE